MTLKMSQKNALLKDIDLYTFQDADATQMHMYMPTYAFINFFGNMQVIMMSQLGADWEQKKRPRFGCLP